jgi:hypothetical protein
LCGHQQCRLQLAGFRDLNHPGSGELEPLPDAAVDDHGGVGRGMTGSRGGLQEVSEQDAVERYPRWQVRVGGQLGADSDRAWIRSPGPQALHRGEDLAVVGPAHVVRANQVQQFGLSPGVSHDRAEERLFRADHHPPGIAVAGIA